MNYNPLESPSAPAPTPTPTTQVKLLPLAPIVSTPQDRRGNTATVSTRRGSSIFSPTQTLNYIHNHNHNHNLPPPPDPDPVHKTTAPTPNFKNSSIPPPPPPPQPPQSAAGETSTTTTTTTTNSNNNSISAIRYKECLKNHAASMGGHVVDGCGEFMPSGDEGTPESLRCAACDCHRNFHRKIVQGQYNYNHTNNRTTTTTTAPLLQGPSSLVAPRHQQQSVGPTPPTMVNFGGGGATAESSSEDIKIYQSSSAGTGGGHAVMQPPSSSFSGSKKRFRTKFSQEQKERMHDFAEKLGWKMQKQDEQEVVQFCNEVGVKRQVFKVFMHNNKQAIKKRQI
ncbi:hypothetical protein ACJIZ3_014465 [Penstemon smallii]|uniref:ZF-HD dimerization-type domain-containing protein n=1 Tax=Penstemon smallii TaxID=265156 RepID=A0ABD3RJM6_9LAMI